MSATQTQLPAAPASVTSAPAAAGTGTAASGTAAATAATSGPASGPTLTSALPEPPGPLVNLFTDENISAGLCPDPPAPIRTGSYSQFGVEMTCEDLLVRSLESQAIPRLYPRHYDHKQELKLMNLSSLTSFLDLLDILVLCPDAAEREEKCQDIGLLFIQMHHLINELRPHQARETLRISLLHQRNTCRQLTDQLNDLVISLTNEISSLVSNISDLLIESIVEDEDTDCLLLKKSSNSSQDQSESEEVTDELTTEDWVELDAIMCRLVLTDSES